MSKFNVTEAQLAGWGGAELLKEAQQAVKRGSVISAAFENATATGEFSYSGRGIRTGFTLLPNGMVQSNCPCIVNRRDGRICVHVVALGIVLARRAHPATNATFAQQDAAHAEKTLSAVQGGESIPRATVERGGKAAEIALQLPSDWIRQFRDGRITVKAFAVVGGLPVPLDRLPRGAALALSKLDDSLLLALEDICEGKVSSEIEMTKSDLLDIIDFHNVHRKLLRVAGGSPLEFLDRPTRVRVTMDLDRENGELLLAANALHPGTDNPDYLAKIFAFGNRGWVVSENRVSKIDGVLPGPYQGVYAEPVAVPRTEVVRFMRQEKEKLRALTPFDTEIDESLFEFVPAEPTFSVKVRGSEASCVVTLYAQYEGGISLPAATAHVMADFAVPDPEDILRYEVRNLEGETLAVQRLNHMGLSGGNGCAFDAIVGTENVYKFLGSTVPELRRMGWKVVFEGPIAEFSSNVHMAVPFVKVAESAEARLFGDVNWFEVGVGARTADGATISPVEVQRALRMGESFIERGSQRYLFDADAVQKLRDIFTECSEMNISENGIAHLDNVYAPYLLSTIESLKDDVVCDAPDDWRRRAEAQNHQERVEPVPLGEPLDGILRPYQKQGVAWLRFLEANGACGILADEMGLGKTLQTLAWLQLKRCSRSAQGIPALIVCPTSLVQNWRHEAERFVPQMRVITMTGAHRHDHWDAIGSYDLVVTSYALVRLDIERYSQMRFSCAILDEAQHIKNRSTQNAKAVKQIQAAHRLVLTGTPLENSVADLWSIMDFLMPGYLGSYASFHADYERPIESKRDAAQDDQVEADAARQRLRRKLHPFLLRRRKQDVAKDLPDKIVKISYCDLSPDQRVVYDALRDKYSTIVRSMVAESGFNRSRMVILALLMRLRQVCCHIALLKNDALTAKAAAPSAKMEQFFELLDEAIDGGHRMLVFSQFVSMLTLLRAELEKRGIPYSYLDGATKDRLEACTRFNRDKSIPVFLISLRAGGTGLNLTGADMVVHFDPWWNPAVEDQATDRAHRIGQKNTVYSIKLITQDTVEERVLAMQQHKQALIGAMVEGDEQTMEKLTWDDVRELFGIDEGVGPEPPKGSERPLRNLDAEIADDDDVIAGALGGR